jgi:hypothetical protein
MAPVWAVLAWAWMAPVWAWAVPAEWAALARVINHRSNMGFYKVVKPLYHPVARYKQDENSLQQAKNALKNAEIVPAAK